jgi:hypothetical protein
MTSPNDEGFYVQILTRKSKKVAGHLTITSATVDEIKTAILKAEAEAANRQLEALQADRQKGL